MFDEEIEGRIRIGEGITRRGCILWCTLTVRIMKMLIKIEIAEKKDEEGEEKEEEFGVDLDAEDNETDFGWFVSFIPDPSRVNDMI